MRNKLWKIIRLSNKRQYEVAEELELHPTRLSQLANGLSEPTKIEICKLTEHFDKSEQELFQNII